MCVSMQLTLEVDQFGVAANRRILDEGQRKWERKWAASVIEYKVP